MKTMLASLLVTAAAFAAPLGADELFTTPRIDWPEEPPVLGFSSNPYGAFSWDGSLLSASVGGGTVDGLVGGAEFPQLLSLGTFADSSFTAHFQFTGGPLVSAYAPQPERGIPGGVTWNCPRRGR